MNFAPGMPAAGGLVATASNAPMTPLLRCDVTAFGSVYLGGFTWTRLTHALRVEELVSGAAANADAIFEVASAPWCPEIF